MRLLELRTQCLGCLLAPEYAADQPVQRRIVQRRQRVSDDEVGYELRQRLGRKALQNR